MEELNTLDLLKSLTLGVNNKINQEQDSEIEYIVDTLEAALWCFLTYFFKYELILLTLSLLLAEQ